MIEERRTEPMLMLSPTRYERMNTPRVYKVRCDGCRAYFEAAVGIPAEFDRLSTALKAAAIMGWDIGRTDYCPACRPPAPGTGPARYSEDARSVGRAMRSFGTVLTAVLFPLLLFGSSGCYSRNLIWNPTTQDLAVGSAGFLLDRDISATVKAQFGPDGKLTGMDLTYHASDKVDPQVKEIVEGAVSAGVKAALSAGPMLARPANPPPSTVHPLPPPAPALPNTPH